MTNQVDDLWAGDLDEAEIAEGLREASNELRGWIENSFEADLQKRAIAIARQKREGVYKAKAEREHIEKLFRPDADLGEVEKANRRLSELLAKPHLSKSEEAERVKLTKTVEAGLKKYSSPSSKKWRE